MRFSKMHGCGNDYVFIDCIRYPLTPKENDHLPEIAKRISNRMTGVGSDGLILIQSSQVADYKMEMYNADGSQGEMCGNGIRCVAKHVYDSGLAKKRQLQIETKAGIRKVEVLGTNKETYVKVDMGAPILIPEKIPVLTNEKNAINLPIKIAQTLYQVTCISMGNPHAILFVQNVFDVDVTGIGQKIETHTMFPNRTNVEFIQVVDEGHIKMRVWERGSKETYACGTGACASVVACVLHGFTKNKVDVKLLGGTLSIEYDTEKGTVYMTGPAVHVYDGQTIEI